ncbi:unnamed protein product [Closterium sp. NIES-53]
MPLMSLSPAPHTSSPFASLQVASYRGAISSLREQASASAPAPSASFPTLSSSASASPGIVRIPSDISICHPASASLTLATAHPIQVYQISLSSHSPSTLPPHPSCAFPPTSPSAILHPPALHSPSHTPFRYPSLRPSSALLPPCSHYLSTLLQVSFFSFCSPSTQLKISLHCIVSPLLFYLLQPSTCAKSLLITRLLTTRSPSAVPRSAITALERR